MWELLLTSLLWDQMIAGGGSGAYRTIQVRFIVDPLLINRSAPPTISVTGSVEKETRKKGWKWQDLALRVDTALKDLVKI